MQVCACRDVVTEEDVMRGSMVGDGPVDARLGAMVGGKLVMGEQGLLWVMAVLPTQNLAGG